MGKAIRISPDNLLKDWGYVEAWAAGTSVAPSGWVMAGTSGSVAREATEIKYGTYSMKIISGSSNSYKAEVSLPNYDDYQGRTITFGMWVKCGTADKARIYIDDGVSPVNSSYHTGGGSFEFLTVEIQVDASATELTFGCEVQNNAITAYFDGGIAVEGETVFTEFADYIDNWKPDISFRKSSFTIARKEGVYLQSVRPNERKVRVGGNVVGTDYAACRASFDSIMTSVLEGKKNIFLYDDRLVEAYLVRHTHDYNAALRMIEFSFEFTAPDPFMRYIARLRDQQTISSSPTSFDFAYNGNYKTYPRITFTPGDGDMESCTLENLTTGQSMAFSGTVTDGDDLIIDCDERSVENDGADAIGDFSGDFLRLVPGTNYLKFTGTTGVVIKTDYFEKWV